MHKILSILIFAAACNPPDFQDRFNEALSFEEHAEYSVTYTVGERIFFVPESDAWYMFCDVADREHSTYFCTMEVNINKSPPVR